MSSEGSVSRLLEGLKGGDDAAITSLWARYCDRLVGLARKKLRNARRLGASADDIANNVFYSLCAAARRGRFPALAHRDGLWGLLVFITAQKAADQIRYEQQNGRDKEVPESALGDPGGSNGGGINRVLSPSPGPKTLNLWAEEYARLLALLDRQGDPMLRQVAELRVQGYKIEEIAAQLGRSRQAIHRKIDIIESAWLPEVRR
jgi:DNA-directed RNA polymerase specialized sigma24 family protein